MNKSKIIQKSETFSKIISTCPTTKSKYFSIYYEKSNSNLYGITVPKKVGKAHIRNKLKRQIKNVIITNEKNIPNGFNYVIIIKEATKTLSYAKMQLEILNLFKKVGNNEKEY